MKDKKDFDSNDGGTTILDIPPTDSVVPITGGSDDSPFQRWRKKFKNYATYLTHKALNN